MKTIRIAREDRIEYRNELNQLHREGYSAVEYISGIHKGIKQWYINGYRHRLYGPANIWPTGHEYWYYYGKLINCKTQEEFERIIKLAILW